MKNYLLGSILGVSLIIPLVSLAQTADVDTSGGPACDIIIANLRFGARDNSSNGNGVSLLQDFLNSNNYLSSQPTGFFGSLTRKAVIAFQNANNISATLPGFVGQLTRAKIQQIDCGASSTTPPVQTPTSNSPTITSLEPQSPGGGATVGITVIIYGTGFSSSNLVSLRGPAYGNDSIVPTSVSSSQIRFVIPSDVNSGTYNYDVAISRGGNSLSNFMVLPITGAGSTVPTVPLSASSTVNSVNYLFTANLSLGSQGQDVSALQNFLIVRGFPISDTSGSFGPSTKTALTAFENSVGISPAVGYFGPIDRAMVNSLDGQPVNTTTSSYIISNLSPSSGPTGSVVTISGLGFASSGNVVNFGGYTVANVTSVDGKTLQFTVPNQLTPSCYYGYPQCGSPVANVQPGNYDVHVFSANNVGDIVGNLSSNKLPFTVTSGGVITTQAKGDLVISDFSWTPVTPSVDQTDRYLYFTFTVKNVGSDSITFPTDTAFSVYKGSIDPTNRFATLSIGTGIYTLASGASKTFTNFFSQYNPIILSTAGTFPIIMTADDTNLVPESDETNNSLQKTITVSASTVIQTPPPVITATTTTPTTVTLTPPPAWASQVNTACPQSVTASGVTYTLSPCSITATMTDGQGDKNFSTTIVSSAGATSTFGYTVYGYGVGLPTYGILGGTSGGARGNTQLNLHFADSVLSANGNQSRTYTGYLPIRIYQDGPAPLSGSDFLNFNYNLTVNPATN